AEGRARSAVAEGAGPAALVVLAEVLVAQGRPGDAAEAYAAAGAASHELGPWRDAARVAPREALGGILAGLEGIAPGDPVAEAARAWLEGREAPGSVEPRGHLANAHVRLDAGDARGALEALDAWAGARREGLGGAVDGDEAAELRRAALRALWRSDGEGEIDLAAAIDAVGRFATEHGLEPVARDARALRDELDRPLLLAVLGEFNAGKSTLINAFIGAGVAPMGIVPTTATLNVLRGGAERLVRVVRRDGSTREGDYASLASMLEEAELLGSEAAGAEAIDRVEIVLPSETLERVWILDAPGTNALDEAHEELAHEAARRADAVLWVFDAAQAGKLTETKMHRQIRAQGRRVLPVLNKVDRLKEGELERVAAVVREGFGAAPIPLSAKKALKARLADDEGAYAGSGFPGLLEALEASIFSQSRALKRAACAGRLARTLDGALVAEEEAERAHEARRAELAAEREALVERASDVVLAVDDAVRALDRDLDEAFEAAADEVLGFVRPRAHRFAEHGVHPEDRAFLADLLERRLRHALDRCEARLVARLRGVLHGAAAGGEGDAAEIGERVRGAIRPPLSAFWGYQRGVLAGGSLRRFFEEVLPRADLEREALAGALMRARSAPRDELRPPLVEAAEALHRALVQERDDAVEALAAERHHAAAAVFGPLRALREVLAEIAAAPARAPALANDARDE
ncbi:MAG TPA: dynamin family protein, partial [Polyangiaceae bacterium LLY-WYZ-15_(1-7)]|nr:dynamin family protein [Polyangiaceae bacterium LLY-WYZ-15_(1-7)]